MDKLVMHPRTAPELDAIRIPLSGLKVAGFSLFPVGAGKVPRDQGWQTREYSDGELKRWAARGGNIGVALGPGHLIMDVDPRNFEPEDNPFKRLCADVAATFGNAPVVFSGRGDGGQHLYMHKPERLRIPTASPNHAAPDNIQL